MTNKEWLDYLAHNAPDELSAWFDAEHVETEERALDGDTESESINTDAVSERYATAFKWLDRLDYGKGGVIDNSPCDTPEQGDVVMPLESWREHLATESDNEDSRDKLEADVRKIAEAYNMDTQRHGTERFEHELYHSIMHLLDRQAAITERECRKPNWDYCETCETLAELTAERDKLQEQLRIGWECECRLQAERDELKAEHERIVQELVDVNTRQCERTNELTAERDNWKANCEDWKKDCERYREKFGKCLDYADAIHALMDDEGMA